MAGGLNEITPLFGSGFTPASLQLNGAAALSGSNLRLTDGGLNQNASAFYRAPVDVSGDFSTTFQFRMTPSGSTPMGEGFTFDIQNTGNITELQRDHQDALGLTTGPHIAIKFDAENTSPWPGWSGGEQSDNATGLYIGTVPGFSDNTEISVPKTLIDFKSGHTIQATIAYTASAGTSTGHISETLTDLQTGALWSYTYNKINIQSTFQLRDVDGTMAYAGFTGSTGSPSNDGGPAYVYGKGRSVQDILNWSWNTSSGATATALPYAGSFSLDSAQMTTGAVFDAHNQLLRTLWQANPLSAGTHAFSWDGLDDFGNTPDPSAHPAPYQFRVTSASVDVARSALANASINPTDPNASISALGVWGVAVSPDGTKVWTAITGGDTSGGGFVKQLNGDGSVDATNSRYLFNYHAGMAVAADSGYLYVAASTWNWSGEQAIIKIRLSDKNQAIGFTALGQLNPDGSAVVTTNGYTYLSVLKNDSNYLAIRGVAVSNPNDPSSGVLWLTDYDNGLIRRYDKVTGLQVGTPFPIEHPTGIALDSAGNAWVAHGNAGAYVVSVYDSSGKFLRDVTEAAGLREVSGLAIVANTLYIADRGAGHVVVYTIAGTSLTDAANPVTIGRPATYGSDDGRNTFWDLRGVAADAQGNVYTVQNTIAPGLVPGAQVEKWSPTGTSLWVTGGYEYESVAGAYSASDPTTLYSTSLHRYQLSSAGVWTYSGSAAYAGFKTNRWSGLGDPGPASSTRFIQLGGKDFLVMSTGGGSRLIFFTVGAGGELHPSAIVGVSGLVDGHGWSWSDSRRDGIPRDSQIQDSGVTIDASTKLTVDPSGSVYAWTKGASGTPVLLSMPLQGFDSVGNPVFDWGKAGRPVDLPATTVALDIGADGVYVEYIDPRLGPQPSTTVYGGYSSGGANALTKLTLDGATAWTIPLPRASPAIAAVPSGGAIIGGMVGGEIFEVDASGEVIADARPSGDGVWLDLRGGSLSVSRNPSDGKLDIFTQDLGYSASLWYRFDDEASRTTLDGTVITGQTVTLLHANGPPIIPPPNPPAPASPSAPVLVSADDTGVKGDGVTAITSPRLRGTAQPGTTVDLIDDAGTVIGSGAVSPDGAYLIPASLPADGVWTIRARVEDASGQFSKTSAGTPIVLDTTLPAPPSTPILNAVDDSGIKGDHLTNIRTPRLSGTAEPNTTVELFGSGGTVLGTAIAGSNGGYSIIPSAPFPDGMYVLTVVAIDATGNLSRPGPTLSLTIDATPPRVPSLPALLPGDDSGLSGDGLTNVTQPRLVGLATPGVLVCIINEKGMIAGWSRATPDGQYLIQVATLAEGVHAFRATAGDDVGNVSGLSPVLTFSIKTSPPATPAAPSLLPAGGTGHRIPITTVRRPRFSGMATPGLTVELLDSTGTVLASAPTALTNGTYSLQPVASLPIGLSTLTVRVRDNAGNVSATSGPVAVRILGSPPAGVLKNHGKTTRTRAR